MGADLRLTRRPNGRGPRPNGRHDTVRSATYGARVSHRSLGVALVVAGLVAALGSPAGADPGTFRRTTPRAVLVDTGDALVLGIPASRAWGVESGLRPLGGDRRLTIVLAVDDPEVAEAFVRIAYYARDEGRSRQLAIQDSAAVRDRAAARLTVILDPPPGAVAYRVRILGRLTPGAARSGPDAIRARWAGSGRGLERPILTRLLSDLP